MNITRDELVRKLVDMHGHISYKDMCSAVDHIFAVMTATLQMNGRIEVRGFGSFSVRQRQARLARNPKTGATVQTEQRQTVYFRAGKELRERVNNAKDVD